MRKGRKKRKMRKLLKKRKQDNEVDMKEIVQKQKTLRKRAKNIGIRSRIKVIYEEI